MNDSREASILVTVGEIKYFARLLSEDCCELYALHLRELCSSLLYQLQDGKRE